MTRIEEQAAQLTTKGFANEPSSPPDTQRCGGSEWLVFYKFCHNASKCMVGDRSIKMSQSEAATAYLYSKMGHKITGPRKLVSTLHKRAVHLHLESGSSLHLELLDHTFLIHPLILRSDNCPTLMEKPRPLLEYKARLFKASETAAQSSNESECDRARQ